MGDKMKTLPITYSVKEEVGNDTDRFLHITIDVLHTGRNSNGSIFSKEVVDENIETIKNTPVLGFIKEVPCGEEDFDGHKFLIVRDDNGVKRKYLGQAYGVVHESCNPRWITKVTDSGEEREFLQVDALLWKKFGDAVDIMERDQEKSHSMELYPYNYEGYDDEDGNFVVTKFSFDGCCILGDDKEPAMENSNIQVVNFTMTDFVKSIQSELSNKYTTFTAIVNEKSNQGGIRAMSVTDFTQTLREQFSDISNMVSDYETIADRWGYEYPRYYSVDILGSEVIVVDAKDHYNYYGFSFTMQDDKPVIDFTSGKRKKLVYEDYSDGESSHENMFDFSRHIEGIEDRAAAKISALESEKESLEADKTAALENYSAVKGAFEDMKPKYEAYVLAEEQHKAEELNAEKDAKFAEYESMLASVAEFSALKEKRDEMTVEDIEKECAVLYVKAIRSGKTNFSKGGSNAMTVGVIDRTADDNGYIETIYGMIPVAR